MKRVLILTGDAGEALEIYYAKFRLEELGWTAHIAAPAARVFHSVVHDFEPGFDTYTEKPGYRVTADLGIDDVQAESYDGLVLPGGRAPEYLRNRPSALRVVGHFLETGKPIAANCHGPLLLLRAAAASRSGSTGGNGGTSLAGRAMTAYPDLACDLEEAGVVFRDAPVVVDGNLVTVRGWPDNAHWMREFVKLMGG